MQFNFYISKVIPVNENGLSIITGTQKRNPPLDEILNIMGEASAKVKDGRTLGIRFEISYHKQCPLLPERLKIIHQIGGKSRMITSDRPA